MNEPHDDQDGFMQPETLHAFYTDILENRVESVRLFLREVQACADLYNYNLPFTFLFAGFLNN